MTASPRPCILLADNDPALLGLWAELLRRSDYDVIAVSSVAEAREAVRRGGIDVAVLDLRLEDDRDPQDVSGLQLARELAGSGPVPTILMSGDPGVQERHPNRFLAVVAKQQGPVALLQEIAALRRASLNG